MFRIGFFCVVSLAVFTRFGILFIASMMSGSESRSETSTFFGSAFTSAEAVFPFDCFVRSIVTSVGTFL